MNGNELNILVNLPAREDLVERIRQVAPMATIYLTGEIPPSEHLLHQIDVTYGRYLASLFDKGSRLKWLQSVSAGVDWVSQPAVQEHPAIVTNSPIHAVPISEHLFGMLLMLSRKLDEAMRYQLVRQWHQVEPWPGMLTGKTLCIVGLGEIGRRCAEIGKALGMRVIGVRRRENHEPVEGVSELFSQSHLNKALKQADVVFNLLPNTQATRHVFNADRFAAMRDGSLFLNAGRGQTVDQDALIDALVSGKLAGAGLDVTDPEPLPVDSVLWQMPRVIITAHYAGNFEGYWKRTDELFLENLRRFLAGEPLLHVVDKKQGY